MKPLEHATRTNKKRVHHPYCSFSGWPCPVRCDRWPPLATDQQNRRERRKAAAVSRRKKVGSSKRAVASGGASCRR